MSSLNSQKQQISSSPFTSFSQSSNQVLNNPVSISKLFKPLNIIQEQNSFSSLSTTTQIANTISEDLTQFPIIVPPRRIGIDESFNKINIKNIKSINEISINKNLSFKEKNCCTCTKTKCIKKYCECFAIGKYCIGCHCVGCLNKPNFNKNENEETNQNLNTENNNQNINYNNIINNINISNNENLNQNDISFISCTCSKSFCNKKYCECFKAGKKCSEKCRCLHCLNGNNNNNDNNESYLNEDNYCNRSNSENNLNEVKPEDYTMQTTSVFISKSKTIIEVEKKDKEDMKKLISLKRNRDNS